MFYLFFAPNLLNFCLKKIKNKNSLLKMRLKHLHFFITPPAFFSFLTIGEIPGFFNR
ncbi:hypothetical Protein psc4_01180 [Candidatus Phytoplasma solani]